MKWLVVAGSVTEAAMTILNDTGHVAVKSTRENTVVSLTHTLVKDAFQTGCHSEDGPYCGLLAPPPIRWTEEYQSHSPYVVVETGRRPFWVAEGKPQRPDAESPLNPPHLQFKPRHWSTYQMPNGLPAATTIYDDLAVHSTPGAEEKLLSMSLAMHSQSHAIERQIDGRRESLMETLPRPEQPPPTFHNRIKVTRLPGIPRRKRRSRVFVEKRVEVTRVTKGGELSPRAQSAESRVSVTNLRWTGRALLFLVGPDVWPGLTKVQGLHSNNALLRQGVSLFWRGHWQVSAADHPLVIPSFVKSRPFPDSSSCLRITSRTSEIWFSKPVLLSGLYIWLEDVNTPGMLLVEGIPFQENAVNSAARGNPSGHYGTPDLLGFENVSKGWKAVLPFNEFHRRRVETQPLGGGWIEVTSLSDQAHVSRIGSLRFQFLNEELKGSIPRTRDPPEPPAGFYTFPKEEGSGPAFLPFSSDSVVHEKPRVCFGGLQVNVPVPLWQMDWADIDNVTEEREVLRAPRSSERSLALAAILERHKERDAYNAIPSSLPATLLAVSDNKLASSRLLSSLKSGSQQLWVPRPPLKSTVLGASQPSTVEGLKQLRLKQRETVKFEDEYLKNFYPRKTKAFPSPSFQLPGSHSDAFSSRPVSGMYIHHGTRLSADQMTFIGTHVPLESPVATLEELRRLRRGLARAFGPWTLITSVNLHHSYARFIGAHAAKEVQVVTKLEALLQSAAQDALTRATQNMISNTHLSLGGGEIHEALNAAFTDMVSAEIRAVLSENSEMIAQVQEADIDISALDPAKMEVGVSLHAQLEDDHPITLSLNVNFSDVVQQIFFDEQNHKRAAVVSVEAKPITLKMVTELDPASIHSFFEDEKAYWAKNKTGNLYIENNAPRTIGVDSLDNLKLSSLEVDSAAIVELLKQLLSSEVAEDDLDPSKLFEFLGGDTIIGQPDSLAWSEWLQENVAVGPLNEDL